MADIKKHADYLAFIGHNVGDLCKLGMTFNLQYSDNNSTWIDAFAPMSIDYNTIFLKEFDTGEEEAEKGHRYWRLSFYDIPIPNSSTEPLFLTICIWGEKTELSAPQIDFDPHQFEDEVIINKSYGGKVTGIHTFFSERQLEFQIKYANLDVYDKVLEWRTNHGMQHFFCAFDIEDYPDDIYLVYPDESFENPFNEVSYKRKIKLKLYGRKEF